MNVLSYPIIKYHDLSWRFRCVVSDGEINVSGGGTGRQWNYGFIFVETKKSVFVNSNAIFQIPTAIRSTFPRAGKPDKGLIGSDKGVRLILSVPRHIGISQRHWSPGTMTPQRQNSHDI